jgi:chitin disaccharide deacetylase
MPVPSLIITADDFGIHPSTNAGILSAYRSGVVSSLSVMVTMPHLDKTCDDLRASGAPAGLHLSLTDGRAVAAREKVPNLVDETGRFCRRARDLLMLGHSVSAHVRLLDQIREEFDAQLSLASDHGIRLTHVDSHQHIHMNPEILSIVAQLAPRFGVHRIRWTREPAWPLFVRGATYQAIWRRNQLKWLVLRWLTRGQSAPLTTTDSFLGIIHSGIISRKILTRLLRKLPVADSTEICIHPGFPPALKDEADLKRAGIARFTISHFRQIEHDALVDPEVADIIRRRGLRLVSAIGKTKGES